MVINSNIDALNTFRQYTKNSTAVSKSMEKLSSGLRINHASDDAAGLAISEKMKAQISGLSMASKNSQDAISLAQTSEGALSETQSILQRMRELAVQSASDTNQDTDRDALQAEFSQLTAEINDISSQTKFNNITLLDGTYASVTVDTATSTIDTTKTATAGAEAGSYSISFTAASVDTTNSTLYGESGVTITADDLAKAGTYTVTADGANNVKVTDADGKEVDAAWDSTNKKLTFNGVSIAVDSLTDLSTAADTGKTIVVKGAETSINKDGTGAVAGTIDENGTATFAASHVKVKNVNTTVGSSAKTLALEEGQALTIQTGADEGETLKIHMEKMDAQTLGFDGNVKISDLTDAQNAITTIDDAIKTVSDQRGTLGALENRLEHKINNLDTSTQNLTSAQSRIADVDMASEMVEYTKNSILVQASEAMLAQAKNQPQSVLQLLQQ